MWCMSRIKKIYYCNTLWSFILLGMCFIICKFKIRMSIVQILSVTLKTSIIKKLLMKNLLYYNYIIYNFIIVHSKSGTSSKVTLSIFFSNAFFSYFSINLSVSCYYFIYFSFYSFFSLSKYSSLNIKIYDIFIYI